MISGELPLSNKRIVVTRAAEQSDNIVSMLKAKGATVLLVPTIRIIPANLSSEDELRISSFYKYDVAVFPSANSVKNLFAKITIDKQSPTKPYIIAIGKKTGETIENFGFTPDFIPGKSSSEELVKSLAKFEWKGKSVLIPVGNLSNSDLADFMKTAGAIVYQVVVYKTEPNDSIDNEMKTQILSGQFDMIVFYSPSQVKNFAAIFGADILKGKQIATIGPTTKKSVEHYGFNVAVTPDNSTTEDLITSVCRSGFAQAGGAV